MSGFAGIMPAVKAGKTVIVGYQSPFNSQQHVDFISTPDNHIREFFQTAGGSWNNNDLTTRELPLDRRQSRARALLRRLANGRLAI